MKRLFERVFYFARSDRGMSRALEVVLLSALILVLFGGAARELGLSVRDKVNTMGTTVAYTGEDPGPGGPGSGSSPGEPGSGGTSPPGEPGGGTSPPGEPGGPGGGTSPPPEPLPNPRIVWTDTRHVLNLDQGAFLSADIDGNGMPEVVCVKDMGQTNVAVFVITSTGSALKGPVQAFSSQPNTWDFYSARYVAGDFDGDGEEDIMAFYRYSSGTTAAWFFRSTGTASSPRFSLSKVWESSQWDGSRAAYTAGDIDGNGRDEVVALYDYGNSAAKAWVFSASGSGGSISLSTHLAWQVPAGSWNTFSAVYLPGEFTGDGREDVLAMYYYGGTHTAAFLFVSNGSSFSQCRIWDAGQWNSSLAAYAPVDADRDGRTEAAAVYNYPDRWGLFLLHAGPSSLSAERTPWDAVPAPTDVTWTRVLGGNFMGPEKPGVIAVAAIGPGGSLAALLWDLQP